MSIDLLPSEEGRQRLLRRRAGIAALLLVALWVVLGVVTIGQLALVDDLAAERDAVAARTELVRAQVGSLSVFQRMADDAAAGNRIVASAMGDEVSWAQLLIDLSRGVPESASFTSVNGQLFPTAPMVVGDDVAVATAQEVGAFTIAGYSREVFTPGLEDLLRRFGAIDGLVQEYLSSAQVEAIGDVPVTRFSAEVRLDAAARTGRYADGLPEREG